MLRSDGLLTPEVVRAELRSKGLLTPEVVRAHGIMSSSHARTSSRSQTRSYASRKLAYESLHAGISASTNAILSESSCSGRAASKRSQIVSASSLTDEASQRSLDRAKTCGGGGCARSSCCCCRCHRRCCRSRRSSRCCSHSDRCSHVCSSCGLLGRRHAGQATWLQKLSSLNK